MPSYEDIAQTFLTTLELGERRITVTIRIIFDGIEFVGRLWFIDEELEEVGTPDRGALPGRSREEVMALAERLRPGEILARYRRAMAEKRRFAALRRATDDVLGKIRYLNQLAISMRAGLLDADGAAAEIELTERQLHELVDRLREFAGVEG